MYTKPPFHANLHDILVFFGLLPPKDFKIILLSNSLALSLSDEGYSRNESRAMILISSSFLYFIDFNQFSHFSIAEML
jgi:hypothetical protein